MSRTSSPSDDAILTPSSTSSLTRWMSRVRIALVMKSRSFGRQRTWSTKIGSIFSAPLIIRSFVCLDAVRSSTRS